VQQSPHTPRETRALLDGRQVTIRNTAPKIEQTFLSVGETVGKYRILAEIDRGGMAVVYRAMQLDLDREVALKVIPATVSVNPTFLERFLAEAHAVSKLSHPSIITIHEVAHEGGIYFIAMDYIPGRNLSLYLHEAKPKLVDVLEIISQIADALAYAHRQRIIHRDLKLNNVIMKDDV
jgi:eukaryotic-like serine/threonine-protein kinase